MFKDGFLKTVFEISLTLTHIYTPSFYFSRFCFVFSFHYRAFYYLTLSFFPHYSTLLLSFFPLLTSVSHHCHALSWLVAIVTTVTARHRCCRLKPRCRVVTNVAGMVSGIFTIASWRFTAAMTDIYFCGCRRS